jgi:hypothetical protein
MAHVTRPYACFLDASNYFTCLFADGADDADDDFELFAAVRIDTSRQPLRRVGDF